MPITVQGNLFHILYGGRKLSQKWYWDASKGDAEKYAAKIKEIEPEYVMPKKDPCISFA